MSDKPSDEPKPITPADIVRVNEALEAFGIGAAHKAALAKFGDAAQIIQNKIFQKLTELPTDNLPAYLAGIVTESVKAAYEVQRSGHATMTLLDNIFLCEMLVDSVLARCLYDETLPFPGRVLPEGWKP